MDNLLYDNDEQSELSGITGLKQEVIARYKPDSTSMTFSVVMLPDLLNKESIAADLRRTNTVRQLLCLTLFYDDPDFAAIYSRLMQENTEFMLLCGFIHDGQDLNISGYMPPKFLPQVAASFEAYYKIPKGLVIQKFKEWVIKTLSYCNLNQPEQPAEYTRVVDIMTWMFMAQDLLDKNDYEILLLLFLGIVGNGEGLGRIPQSDFRFSRTFKSVIEKSEKFDPTLKPATLQELLRRAPLALNDPQNKMTPKEEKDACFLICFIGEMILYEDLFLLGVEEQCIYIHFLVDQYLKKNATLPPGDRGYLVSTIKRWYSGMEERHQGLIRKEVLSDIADVIGRLKTNSPKEQWSEVFNTIAVLYNDLTLLTEREFDGVFLFSLLAKKSVKDLELWNTQELQKLYLYIKNHKLDGPYVFLADVLEKIFSWQYDEKTQIFDQEQDKQAELFMLNNIFLRSKGTQLINDVGKFGNLKASFFNTLPDQMKETFRGHIRDMLSEYIYDEKHVNSDAFSSLINKLVQVPEVMDAHLRQIVLCCLIAYDKLNIFNNKSTIAITLLEKFARYILHKKDAAGKSIASESEKYITQTLMEKNISTMSIVDIRDLLMPNILTFLAWAGDATDPIRQAVANIFLSA